MSAYNVMALVSLAQAQQLRIALLVVLTLQEFRCILMQLEELAVQLVQRVILMIQLEFLNTNVIFVILPALIVLQPWIQMHALAVIMRATITLPLVQQQIVFNAFQVIVLLALHQHVLHVALAVYHVKIRLKHVYHAIYLSIFSQIIPSHVVKLAQISILQTMSVIFVKVVILHA